MESIPSTLSLKPSKFIDMKDILGISIMLLPFLLFMLGITIILFKRIKYKEKIIYNKFDFYFVILVLRWYLAYYMIDYGISKLLGDQFGGVNESILNKPLKNIDKFYIAWYFFSLTPIFNIFVGLLQILGGILILINRTIIIGVIILIPIITGILIVDISFTNNMFGIALIIRIFMMLFSCFIILYYYKLKIFEIIKILLTIGKFPNIKWYFYLLMPLIGLFTDFIIATFTLPIRYLMEFLIQKFN